MFVDNFFFEFTWFIIIILGIGYIAAYQISSGALVWNHTIRDYSDTDRTSVWTSLVVTPSVYYFSHTLSLSRTIICI